IPTTPGDRLFVGLLVSAYLNLIWIGLTEASLWIVLAICVVWMAAVMRWGGAASRIEVRPAAGASAFAPPGTTWWNGWGKIEGEKEDLIMKAGKKTLRRMLLCGAVSVTLMLSSGMARADMDAAKKWIDQEFQPSVLTKDQQMQEMEWFIKAAAPYKGMHIK